MAKSIKFKNETYLDSSSIVHNHQVLVDIIYPVGSVYISINSTNPSTLFGGTWEQIQDRFLLSCGSSYSAGTTGGEATHTLNEYEIPSHRHQELLYSHNWDAGFTIPSYSAYAKSFAGGNGQWAWSDVNEIPNSEWVNMGYTAWTGGGEPHNNMPPYLAVYMWKRTK